MDIHDYGVWVNFLAYSDDKKKLFVEHVPLNFIDSNNVANFILKYAAGKVYMNGVYQGWLSDIKDLEYFYNKCF